MKTPKTPPQRKRMNRPPAPVQQGAAAQGGQGASAQGAVELRELKPKEPQAQAPAQGAQVPAQAAQAQAQGATAQGAATQGAQGVPIPPPPPPLGQAPAQVAAQIPAAPVQLPGQPGAPPPGQIPPLGQHQIHWMLWSEPSLMPSDRQCNIIVSPSLNLVEDPVSILLCLSKKPVITWMMLRSQMPSAPPYLDCVWKEMPETGIMILSSLLTGTL